MSTLLHVILDRAPALTTLAQECKGCPGTLCKGCHGTEHEGGCPYVNLLRVDQIHHVFGVAQSRRGTGGKDFIQATQVVLRQFQIHCGGVFLKILAALRAGDGDNVVTLRQHPRERQLGWLASFFARDLFDFFHEIEILLKVFALEAWRGTAIVIGCQVFEFLELAGKKASSKRAVGDEADAEFAAGCEDFLFRIARPKRILCLQRSYGMHLRGAAQSVDPGFRQADMSNLALLDQFCQGANRLFNRRIGIDAMLVIEVDVLDAQPLQTSFAGLLHVVGLAADTADVGIARIADNSELCGQHDLVALALDRSSDELFVLVGPVDVGGIEEGDAEFEGAMNGRDRFGVIASGVELRHAHAAEAEGGNFETGTSKSADFHTSTPFAEVTIWVYRCDGREEGYEKRKRSTNYVASACFGI